MLGDVGDFVGRLKRVLPPRWFGDIAVNEGAVLSGFGTAWASIYTLIQAVRAQSRLATAYGGFIDRIAADFFGAALPRRPGEADTYYRIRIGFELLRPRGTRAAMVTAMTELTGQTVSVFEPSRPADTGGYNVGGVGYGVAGGWGNLSLPLQTFLIVQRPQGGGIADVAGYRTGGALAYGNQAMVTTQVTDADIYASAAAIMPVAYTVWTQIRD
jgi:hypothetical protein